MYNIKYSINAMYVYSQMAFTIMTVCNICLYHITILYYIYIPHITYIVFSVIYT